MGSDLGKRKGGDGLDVFRLVAAFVGGCIVTFLLLRQQRPLLPTSSDCAIDLGKYKGGTYTTSRTIGRPTCLLESKFLKVQLHKVQLEKGASVIEDWLWIDYHDRINVLVEAPQTTNKDSSPRFLIFEQTKYALEDHMSLAITGGLVEPGETPERAAKREVLEETGHVCTRWNFLGRYRTDVNRGVGWTNTFLARECKKQGQQTKPHPEDTSSQVGASDMERQDLRLMSLEEVQVAVKEGRFLEIQWSATVALAMLYYDNERSVRG